MKVLNASAGTGKTHFILGLLFKDDKGRPKSAEEVRKTLDTTVLLSFSNAAVEELRSRIYRDAAALFGVSYGTVREKMEQIPQPRVQTIHSFVMELSRILRYDIGLPAGMEFDMGRENGIWHEACDMFFRENGGYKIGKIPELSGIDPSMFELYYGISDRKAVTDFIRDKGRSVYFMSEGFVIKNAAGPGTRAGVFAEPDTLYSVKEQIDMFRQGQVEVLDEKALNVIDLLNKCAPVVNAVCRAIGERYYLPCMFEKGIFEYDGLVFKLCSFLKEKNRIEGADWLRERLKRENFDFENLYVDEAQDNDIMQNYLIYSVMPPSINRVIVGDPKQSIFHFRNAIPAQFTKAYEELFPETIKAEGRWPKRSTLRNSYRITSQQLLDYINRTCLSIKGRVQNLWDYSKERDELEIPAEKAKDEIFKMNKADIAIHSPIERLSWGKCLKKLPEFIGDDFLNDGKDSGEGLKVGVLVRTRKDLKTSRVQELLVKKNLEKNIRYKLSLSMSEEMPLQHEALLVVLDMLSVKKRNEAAMRLVFTKAGRMLLNASGFSQAPEKTAKLLGNIRFELDKLRQRHAGKGLVRPICEILDGMSASGCAWANIADDRGMLPPHEIVRNMNFALNALWQEEAAYGSAFTAEEAAEMTGGIKMPYEWFGALDSINPGAAGGHSIEITTIHSSKGKAYDRVVVVSDFIEDLKKEPDRGIYKDGKYFKAMMAIDFEKVITDEPEIKADFFPYLESLTGKIAKEKILPDGHFIYEMYNRVARDVLSQKFNLLYVAMTRSKKDIILLGRALKLNKKGEVDETLAPVFGLPINELEVDRDPTVGASVDFVSSTISVPVMAVPEALSSRTVKSEIENYVKHGANGEMSAQEKYYRINAGSAAHAIIQSVFSDMKKPEDFESLVEKHKAAGARYGSIENKAAAKALLSETGSKNAKKLAAIAGGASFRPEMRLWMADDKGLLKGSVDGVFLKEKTVYVSEFKTVFGKDSSNQVNTGRAQVKKYSELLESIKPEGFTIAGDKQGWDGVVTIDMKKDTNA